MSMRLWFNFPRKMTSKHCIVFWKDTWWLEANPRVDRGASSILQHHTDWVFSIQVVSESTRHRLPSLYTNHVNSVLSTRSCPLWRPRSCKRLCQSSLTSNRWKHWSEPMSMSSDRGHSMKRSSTNWYPRLPLEMKISQEAKLSNSSMQIITTRGEIWGASNPIST